MLPAQNRGAGMNFGFPDVCLTPVGPAVVPIPYPNMAFNATAAVFCPTILWTMMPAFNMASIIPMTTGDEPGVAHPTIKGPATFTMGNPKVLLEMLSAITLTSMSTGNTMNDGCAAALVPSATNVFLTYRAEAAGDADRALRARDGGAFSAELGEGGVGLVRIGVFSADVPARLHRAVSAFASAGLRELVIDLRGCPGGELDAAVALASDFLEAGSLFATMIEADGDEVELRTRGGEPYRFPVTLLVDGGTASAAELFAGCLKAHGRAAIAGERTHGKGWGASLTPARDGSGALWETRVTFRLPDGEALDGAGVEPSST